MQIKLIFARKVCTWPHFKSEGFWNSEVAYYGQRRKIVLCTFLLIKLFAFIKKQTTILLSTLEKASKCSEPKWNHDPLASSFTAKFFIILASFLWSMKKRKPPSRDFYGLYSHQPYLLSSQCARNRSVIVKNVHIMVDSLTVFRYRKANHFIDAAKLLFKVSIIVIVLYDDCTH